MWKRYTVNLLFIGLSLGLLASASGLTESTVDDEQKTSLGIQLVDKDGAEKVRYTWVGFHGSCSPHKSSLEKELRIPWNRRIRSNDDIRFPLGDDRFYTTDDLQSAQSRAMSKDAECGGRRSNTRHQPITCSIFIDSSKLSDLRKYYFPLKYQIKKTGEMVYLRHDEDALEKWESLLYRMSNGLAETEENGQTTQTLRFARLADWAQRDWTTPILFAAWPKRILKHMKAICKPTVEVTANDLFFERSVEYLALVENSSAPGKEVDPLWGPIQGSRFFQRGNADKLPEIRQ